MDSRMNYCRASCFASGAVKNTERDVTEIKLKKLTRTISAVHSFGVATPLELYDEPGKWVNSWTNV